MERPYCMDGNTDVPSCTHVVLFLYHVLISYSLIDITCNTVDINNTKIMSCA